MPKLINFLDIQRNLQQQLEKVKLQISRDMDPKKVEAALVGYKYDVAVYPSEKSDMVNVAIKAPNNTIRHTTIKAVNDNGDLDFTFLKQYIINAIPAAAKAQNIQHTYLPLAPISPYQNLDEVKTSSPTRSSDSSSASSLSNSAERLSTENLQSALTESQDNSSNSSTNSSPRGTYGMIPHAPLPIKANPAPAPDETPAPVTAQRTLKRTKAVAQLVVPNKPPKEPARGSTGSTSSGSSNTSSDIYQGFTPGENKGLPAKTSETYGTLPASSPPESIYSSDHFNRGKPPATAAPPESIYSSAHFNRGKPLFSPSEPDMIKQTIGLLQQHYRQYDQACVVTCETKQTNSKAQNYEFKATPSDGNPNRIVTTTLDRHGMDDLIKHPDKIATIAKALPPPAVTPRQKL